MASRLSSEEIIGRIACYGQFDRNDDVCLTHCTLHFECALTREREHALELYEHTLQSMAFPHSA